MLQCIPGITNTGGIPTNAPVLVFILSVDAVLAIIEDKRRHKADEEANSAICRVVVDPEEDRTEVNIPPSEDVMDLNWADLRVGRIVKLRNREFAPADLLILAVAESNPDEMSGICYVETKSLDGETNLKLRQAFELTMKAQTEEQIVAYSGVVQSELPNTAISKFSATISLDSQEPGEQARPITINNMILRGCQLRNTDWIYGLVLNTGNDTKIMQSAVKAPSKWSSINGVVNKMIVWLFGFLLVLCITAATVQIVWNHNQIDDASYLLWDPAATSQWFIACGSYFLLMYQIIPVSLYVSISTVMFFQSLFMVMDVEMYHEDSNTRAIVRTMGLNEELGQVSYVFSDKTGTLTCNVMDFRKCCINGVSYGTGTTEIGRAARQREGKPPLPEPEQDSGNTAPYVNFYDPKMDELLSEARDESKEKTKDHQQVLAFFTHLAICHTVIPEKLSDGDTRLSASSPDEQALVAGASYFGFEFESRGARGLAKVRINGNLEEYQVLDVLEFNSDRKRMTVIVKYPSGEIKVLCKGADTALRPRLSVDSTSEMWDKTESLMIEYADEGLRTLVIGSKTINEEEYTEWSKKYKKATSDIEQIEKRKQGQEDNDIDRLMEEMEVDFDLLGATAIEDKLQDGVPSTIAKLGQASIKVWMLTGDKQETAINIAFACQLVDSDMEQIVVDSSFCESDDTMQSKLAEKKAKMRRNQDIDYALIIDGEALEMALTAKHDQAFLAIALACKGVVCCRVSPSQKAHVVRLVRENSPARTLAIGDGANDVAMIQKAHIGVGISGQEGLQAVNSSDYAIAQFRFLQKLLLHHGRLNYMRMSKLVGYMFYKNIVMVLAQYYYMFLTGTSGQKFYNELGFQLYNMCYTSLPIIYLGVFDFDVPSHVSRMYPQLYFPGPKMELFNTYVFLKWMAAAVFESCVIFVFTVYAYNDQTSSVGSADLSQYGVLAFTLVVLICNLKIILIQLSWTYLALSLWLVGIFCWIPISLLIASNWIELFSQDFGVFQNTLSTSIFWLALPVACVTALGRHYTWCAFQRMVYPSLSQIVQEKYVLGHITAPEATNYECEEELKRHDVRRILFTTVHDSFSFSRRIYCLRDDEVQEEYVVSL